MRQLAEKLEEVDSAGGSGEGRARGDLGLVHECRPMFEERSRLYIYGPQKRGPLPEPGSKEHREAVTQWNKKQNAQALITFA